MPWNLHKTLYEGVQRLYEMVSTSLCWKDGAPQTPQGWKLLCSGSPSPRPPRPCPIYFFIWLFTCILPNIVHNKLAIARKSVSQDSVSPYSKLSNLRKGSWEPPICSQVRQMCEQPESPLLIGIPSKAGGLLGLGLYPLGSGLTLGNSCHN